MRTIIATVPVLLMLAYSPRKTVAPYSVVDGTVVHSKRIARAGAGVDPDTVAAIKFTQRLALGGAENPALDVARISPSDIAGDASGQLYVLDRNGFRVLVFNKRGKQVASLGRKGRADGEFLEPTALGVDTKGSVYVADVQREVLVGFADDGYVLPTVWTKQIGAVQQVAFLDTKEIILSTELRDSLVVFRIKSGSIYQRLSATALPEKQLVSWKGCGMLGQTSAPLFWPHVTWTAAGKSIAIIDKGGSRIDVEEILKDPITFDHGLPVENADVAKAKQIIGDSIPMTLRQRKCTVSTEQVAEQAGMAPGVPVYESVRYDHQGRLWAIRTLRVGQPNRADIFTTTGGYAGTVELGKIRPVAFTGPGSIVSLEADGAGAPMIVIYDFVYPKAKKK